MADCAVTEITNIRSRTQIWLSVLIPIYNVHDYLEECLTSIANQMSADDGIEVILLDDFSDDGSRELAVKLCAKFGDAFRLILHPCNQGISAARNALIRNASGTYIWFIDSDDWIMPGSISILRSIASIQSPDIVAFDYIRRNKHRAGSNGMTGQLYHCRDTALFNMFANRKLYLCTKIMKRSIWADNLDFPDGRCFEDVATLPYIVLRARSFYYLAEPLYFYRVRPGSITVDAANKTTFDVKKNDDRLAALSGFPQQLNVQLPSVSKHTRYAIAYFISRELFKIGRYRLNKIYGRHMKISPPYTFVYYVEKMEQCSPIDFKLLAGLHLRQGKLLRWAQMRFWLAFAQLGG
jgi:glycosyltransferase involved in cell wall biosynthesis